MTRRLPRWISKSGALELHKKLISEHGGAPGLRSEALLDSALASPIDLLAYGSPDLFDLAARYAFSLTRNHPFHDGNKRTALTIAGVFLELNGLRLVAPEADAVSAVLALSTKQISEKEFAGWLRTNSERHSKPRSPSASAKKRSPRKKRRSP